ncbi:hypothetical protein DRN02_005115 [Sphingomonas paucimobilis]|uniref:hypothetical protein n=1 Tax=Sphingomonas paucimobilis TaxID=13689 RepID=UPI0010230BE1|nr:hypothetical protein [Sphingomonas paucimobilis]QBE91471.1 hypothetical protein DRN02_005115 [Sphingomonas paucimobilis]
MAEYDPATEVVAATATAGLTGMLALVRELHATGAIGDEAVSRIRQQVLAEAGRINTSTASRDAVQAEVAQRFPQIVDEQG